MFSIIMPAFNANEHLAISVKSVVEQSYNDWELIIIDDCSSTPQLEYIKRYISDDRITLIQNTKNMGAAIARNKALNVAKGNFVAFLDADDYWAPTKLQKCFDMFQANPSVAFLYGPFYQYNQETKRTSLRNVPSKITLRDLFFQNRIGCLTVVLRKDAFSNILFPSIRKRQDYALWILLLKQCKSAMSIEEPLATYRIHQNTISRSNRIGLLKYHYWIYRNILKKTPLSSALLVQLYVINYFFRKIMQ